MTSIISNALLYYDTNDDKYGSFFDKVYYVSYFEGGYIIFYGKNKEELFRSRYEYIGNYDYDTTIWTWSWSMYAVPKKYIQTSKKLLLYGLDIDDPSLAIIKFSLITSRIKLTHFTQLDYQIALASYLSKKDCIFNLRRTYPKDPNEDIFIDVKNIDSPNIMRSYVLLDQPPLS